MLIKYIYCVDIMDVVKNNIFFLSVLSVFFTTPEVLKNNQCFIFLLQGKCPHYRLEFNNVFIC